jgi:diaminopimelate decarboxylase
MRGAEAGASRRSSFVDPATFTPHFAWKAAGEGRSEEVWCGGVSLAAAAEKFGTPTYLYSRAAIEDAYLELHRGLGNLPHTICFAVKSNSNLSILKILAKLGSGFDIVSAGELARLGHIGVPGERIVFSGVGKTREEIREALRYRSGPRRGGSGILLFNVESEAELEVLMEESAKTMSRGGSIPGVSIRVNPDVGAGGHPHISTGRPEHKFGLEWSAAKQLYLAHRRTKWISWQGVSAHIGSQIVTMAPFREALSRLMRYVKELRGAGIVLRYLDFGGGLGVRYTSERPPARADYARAVAQLVRPLRMHLLLEPGRSIMAPAGVLLARVIYTKGNHGKKFVVIDAGMNDMLRPALYGAVHPITRVVREHGDSASGAARADIVGPVCETGDCFLRDWPLGKVQAADVLVIWTAGAYGMAQASNYNERCRPAEVLVEGKRCRLIRRRETHKDLLRNDVLT